jgi:putative sigma-54 modulation protein
MQTIISARGLTVSTSYKDQLTRKLGKLESLWPKIAEARVVLSKEKHRRTAAITLVAASHTFRSEETAPDLAVAADMAVAALGRQVRALKDRVTHRKGRIGRRAAAATGEGTMASADPAGDGEVVVRRVRPKPMSVLEAAEQLRLGSEQFLVFSNARTHAVNVLYRRRDGGLGLIEPVA